jgi:acyl dehydratase
VAEHVTEGPYFDDLGVGDIFHSAPSVTLTPGLATAHQMILGDRLRLPLSEPLSREVLGSPTALAHPALVWDVAIGQSTLVTQRVVANLFYRGLAFHRAPVLGDTLHTTTEVVALRQNRSKPTGLAALRITTVDQDGRPVLDFWRCAMLPLRDPAARTGHDADLDTVGTPPDPAVLAGLVADWKLRALPPAGSVSAGETWTVSGGDVVSSAPELARLTLNVAAVHHDAFAQPAGRLVYGGHTIGLAAAQVCRALPDLVTFAGWHGCDHTGPVREGDTLYSTVTAERVEPLPAGGSLAHLRVLVRARSAADAQGRDVLDWRPIAVLP